MSKYFISHTNVWISIAVIKVCVASFFKMRGFPVHGISDIEIICFCTNTLRYTAVFKQEKYLMHYLSSVFDSSNCFIKTNEPQHDFFNFGQ